MRDLIRVMILGTGQMGAAIARLLLEKDGVEIVGACDQRPSLAGVDLGVVCAVQRELGIPVCTDLDDAVRRSRPEVAIQATGSEVAAVWPDIQLLIRAGVSVISIAEEMTFPWCSSADVAREMHELAVANQAAVLGTGINPGFVLDLLVIVLSGVCARVDGISATRTNDLSPYGETVLRAQGVGLTPAAFELGVRDGSVAGHVGFPESMHLIATALGWHIDRIEQTREPIVAAVRREAPGIVVEPGRVAGCRHRARAYQGETAIISFDHPQQVCPAAEGIQTEDRIEIHGAPELQLTGRPEIAGGQATAAIAVNMIPRVLSAAPGLHTMADLPPPTALQADVRQFLRPREQSAHG